MRKGVVRAIFWQWCAGRYHLLCGAHESALLFAGVRAIADQLAHGRLSLLNHRLCELAPSGGVGN
jgi:hypothetical protein